MKPLGWTSNTACRGSFVLTVLTALLLASAPRPVSAFPDPDGEFFVDFTGQVRGRDKMEIGRTLRSACEESRVHAMLVLIDAMASYPDMPQEITAFANKTGTSWNVGDKTAHKGLVAVFSLKDRKFGCAPTRELNVPNLTDAMSNSMQGRVIGYLREGNVSGAMRVAASNIAEQLPSVSRGAAGTPEGQHTRTTTTTRRVVSPGYTRSYGSSGSGSGWMVGIIFLVIVFFMISGVFSGASHGYGYGGPGYGGGGGGGFFSGMLTGGLLGWMFGGHGGWGGGGWGDGGSYGSSYEETTTTTDSWSSGSSDSGGGSFDSFGGGSFDGGGSSGEW
jgi:uncharacterized membrane protein YgcG